MNTKLISVCLFSFLWIFVPPGFAEGDSSNTVTIAWRHIYPSDIKASDGTIDVTATELALVCKFKVAGQIPVDISLGVGHTDINADTPVDLPSHLESRRLGLSTKFSVPFI